MDRWVEHDFCNFYKYVVLLIFVELGMLVIVNLLVGIYEHKK